MPPLYGNDGFTIGKAQMLGMYFVKEGGAAAGDHTLLDGGPGDGGGDGD